MERINKIKNYPAYKEKFEALQEAEKERQFCNHTLEHFLDVARLMYIKNLENNNEISKEIIYATALMHDIGRIDQIKREIPHEKASADFCDEILAECNFTKEEIELIKTAILAHRSKSADEKNTTRNSSQVLKSQTLQELLYWADKKSRNCFSCKAATECNWPDEKRNYEIEY